MKVYIINLDRNTNRLEKCSKQLDLIGIEYERFSAVDGRKIKPEEFSKCYNDKTARRLLGKSMTPGEIGCALSHIGIYKKIVAENIPFALILEDDAYAMPPLKKILEVYETTMSPDLAVVTLFGEGVPVRGKVPRIYLPFSVYSLGRVYGGYRMHAYVVSLAAARKILDFALPIVTPIDFWGRLSSYGVVDLYTLEPLGIGLDCSDESTITQWNMPQQKRNFFAKWYRRFWRLYWLKLDSIKAFFMRNFK